MRLSGQQEGRDECAWVVGAVPTAAAVLGERTCEIAGNAVQHARANSN